jgi:hypothetical protein
MDAIVGSLRPQGIDLLTQNVGTRPVRAEAQKTDSLIQLLGARPQVLDPIQIGLVEGISPEELVQQILLTSLRGLLDELDEVLTSFTKTPGAANEKTAPQSGDQKRFPDSSSGTSLENSRNQPSLQPQGPQSSPERSNANYSRAAQATTVLGSTTTETQETTLNSGNLSAFESVASNRQAHSFGQAQTSLPLEQKNEVRTPPPTTPQGIPDTDKTRSSTAQGPLDLSEASLEQPSQRPTPKSPPPFAEENTLSAESKVFGKAPSAPTSVAPLTFKNIADFQQLELVRDLLKALIATGAESDTVVDKGVLKALLKQLPSELVRDLAQRSASSTDDRKPNEGLVPTLETPERPVLSDGTKPTAAPRAVHLSPSSPPLPVAKEHGRGEGAIPLLGSPSAPLSASVRDVASLTPRSNLTIALDPALMRALHSAALSRPYQRPLSRKRAHPRRSESSHLLFAQDDKQELLQENQDGDLHESTGLAWLRAFLIERDQDSRR